eukprot:1601088-Rhodomonas_salina.1
MSRDVRVLVPTQAVVRQLWCDSAGQAASGVCGRKPTVPAEWSELDSAAMAREPLSWVRESTER